VATAHAVDGANVGDARRSATATPRALECGSRAAAFLAGSHAAGRPSAEHGSVHQGGSMAPARHGSIAGSATVNRRHIL